jgi:hypothetical protein
MLSKRKTNKLKKKQILLYILCGNLPWNGTEYLEASIRWAAVCELFIVKQRKVGHLKLEGQLWVVWLITHGELR